MDTGASGGAGPGGVPCASAVNGDPCDKAGDFCGADECYGCNSQCVAGHWVVSCSEPPACPAEPITAFSTCDNYCGEGPCGPYPVTGPCGTEMASVQCTLFGWVYSISCPADCASIGDLTTCGATTGCTWMETCPGSPVAISGCVSTDFAVSDCLNSGCPSGQTCQQVIVDMENIAPGVCESNVPMCTD